MPRRKNLVHRKVMNAKPDDIIHCQVSLKAGLLKGKVNNYGQTADYIRAALESYNKTKYGDGLILLIAEIRKTIEELELWRGEQEHENKIDPNNLMLLETYRDVYFRLKGAKILKRKIK